MALRTILIFWCLAAPLPALAQDAGDGTGAPAATAAGSDGTAAPAVPAPAAQAATPAAQPGAADAAAGAAASFDASAWRGAGLEHVKWLFRVFVGRKPSLDEVESFIQLAATPDAADQTMQSLLTSHAAGGLADDYAATFAKRIDGFVHGTQAASVNAATGAGLRLDDGASPDPGADLSQLLAPLVQAATGDQAKCSSNDITVCFGSWLADWVAPSSSATASSPTGHQYLDLLKQIAAAK